MNRGRVGAAITVCPVTEYASPYPHHLVQKPRKRANPVDVADLTKRSPRRPDPDTLWLMPRSLTVDDF